MSNSDQPESPVYVFEIPALRLRKENGGEPVGQQFATQMEAMEWITHQPANKKFVVLTVLTGGGEPTA